MKYFSSIDIYLLVYRALVTVMLVKICRQVGPFILFSQPLKER